MTVTVEQRFDAPPAEVWALLAYEPPQLLRWAVSDPAAPSSTWAYALHPDGDGTRVEHVFTQALNA